jgi:hypothetical protein
MVVRRQIERLPGHRLSVEAEADADADADAETRAGRRAAIISETIAWAYPNPGAEDDDATQTGRVQHREGDRSHALRRDGETATPTSRDQASQSG